MLAKVHKEHLDLVGVFPWSSSWALELDAMRYPSIIMSMHFVLPLRSTRARNIAWDVLRLCNASDWVRGDPAR